MGLEIPTFYPGNSSSQTFSYGSATADSVCQTAVPGFVADGYVFNFSQTFVYTDCSTFSGTLVQYNGAQDCTNITNPTGYFEIKMGNFSERITENGTCYILQFNLENGTETYYMSATDSSNNSPLIAQYVSNCQSFVPSPTPSPTTNSAATGLFQYSWLLCTFLCTLIVFI